MADSRATPPRARGDLSVLPRCKWSGPGELADGSLQLPTAARGTRTCAVVGSSDILRLVPQGSLIDRHALVWRVNNAPTVGFEMSAGRRTSVRVVNHVPVEKWLLRDHNRSALLATRDGREYDRYLCAPDEGIEHGCVLSRVAGGAANGRLQQELRDYRAAHPTHQLTLMNRRMHEYGARCNREIGGNTPSAGLLTVLLALSVCDTPVSLFGFWPFSCHARAGWPAMNYKYSQGNRTRFICCSRGRERMEAEYGFYDALQTRGLVRVHSSPPNRGTRLPDSRRQCLTDQGLAECTAP